MVAHENQFRYDLERAHELVVQRRTSLRRGPARRRRARRRRPLSDRWTFLILREAFFGVRRYGQMQRNLGIARNVLADRLRQLVADGMFERVRYRTDPDWYEYRLTERALDLYPVIVGLMRWADRHLGTEDDADRARAHPPFLRRARRSLSRLLALP